MNKNDSSFPGKIVVTTDFSDASLAAFPYAVNEALHSSAVIELVNVFQTPALPIAPFEGVAPSEVVERIQREAHESAQRKLKELAALYFPGREVKCSILETVGSVGDEITNFARTTKAGLIVTASQGHGLFHRALIGSVAERILHSATCPVLLSPPSPPAQKGRGEVIPYRRIVVPTDFSPASEQAFQTACTQAHRCGAEVSLVYVSEGLGSLEILESSASISGAGLAELQKSYRTEALKRLEKYAERFHPEKCSTVFLDKARSVSGALLAYIEKAETDLVVIASRGQRSRMGMLGGVAEKLTRHAPCAILVVPITK